jgi:4-alpha-glucanotransferase
MEDLSALHALARELGVSTSYVDGLARPVTPSPETLVRVCAALGAPVTGPHDAGEALGAVRDARRGQETPVRIAWDGQPGGWHTEGSTTVISAPSVAWRRGEGNRSWGVSAQLAALRSARSRTFGDLQDLEAACRWLKSLGGDVVTLLPLLPTFNTVPAEPSPYSPVSRLFWSELLLDLGKNGHRPTSPQTRLDVVQAGVEVRAALASHPAPNPSEVDAELARYARFRGAQAKLGRDWRSWPAAARAGNLSPEQMDADEERFHLVAQTLARRQLRDLRGRLDGQGVRLGLDLTVGVHPDGFDTWSRQGLFANGMSVGAPPDRGFPSGQDWGFAPVLPTESRREGHRYLGACIAHLAALAGVLRVDHIMAWTRLYWIPHGMPLDQGTYVSYPAEELFALLTLESHRNRCEIVGENLGTVPPEIDEALPERKIWGMYLAEFQDWHKEPDPLPPTAQDVALVGTHDTPTFAGWLKGNDIADRIESGLLPPSGAPEVRQEREATVAGISRRFARPADDPKGLLEELLEWLGRSESPLVMPWIEDLWLEERGVNLPGTTSQARPNWQRPMRKLLDEVFADAEIGELARRLAQARAG